MEPQPSYSLKGQKKPSANSVKIILMLRLPLDPILLPLTQMYVEVHYTVIFLLTDM